MLVVTEYVLICQTWRPSVTQCVSPFRTGYYNSLDGPFGLNLRDASWNGVVGLLVRGDVHISNSAFIYNNPLLEVLGYLDPESVDRWAIL